MSGTATRYSAQIDYRLPQTPPQIDDPVVANAIGTLWSAVMILIAQQSTTQLGGTTLGVVASANIVFGMPVNLYANAGVLNARPASSSLSYPAHGICSSPAGITAGSTGFITRDNFVANTSGLTLGSNYWLAAAGGVATTADTTAGHIEQYLGIALSATQLFFSPTSWIQH